MTLLHAVPDLLQLIHDVEDETTVLRRACAWLREHAGADGAAVVSPHDLRIVAADGVRQADLEDRDVRDLLGLCQPRTMATSSHAIVLAPLRSSGTTIGMILVRGPMARAEDLQEAALAVASLLAPTLRARMDALAIARAGETLAPEILGHSPAIASVRRAVAQVAGTVFPVLVEGESGTGKELVARAVHRLGPRRDRRLCAVNCAALSDDLVEAELFGHTRGAFTGAVGPRSGLFEEAHHGAMFLDEVAELSPRAQAKLLRVIQEREIRRVGENVPRPVDVRLIAATNVPLVDAVAAGRFREDLRFRLAVVRIVVPPLRERVEDVPLLAQSFWRRLAAETDKRSFLGPDAMAALCRHTWPGNVRELQNVVAGLVVAAPSRGRITERLVSQAIGGRSVEMSTVARLDVAMRGFERRVVAAALARHGGRRTRAARELGLTRQGLTKAIRRLGLGVGTPRAGVA